MVSSVICRLIKFDASVICHVPNIIKCALSYFISIAEKHVASLFNYLLWREKVGDHVEYLYSIL